MQIKGIDSRHLHQGASPAFSARRENEEEELQVFSCASVWWFYFIHVVFKEKLFSELLSAGKLEDGKFTAQVRLS